jgi:hypothetical protein
LNVAGSSNALISARVILEADYERPPVASRRLLFWQVRSFRFQAFVHRTACSPDRFIFPSVDPKIALQQSCTSGVLASFEEYLAIFQRLAQQDPTNTDWQRNLVVAHSSVAALKSQLGKSAN